MTNTATSGQAIARIETFAVAPRWVFLRVETVDGVVGWGEASLEGHTPAVRAAVVQAGSRLIGLDAARIEDHWLVLTKGGFYRGGAVLASAVSGLDQALWDIAGKTLGVPVHRLLGGAVRDRIRVYSWVGGDDPAEVVDGVQARMAAGLNAVKMNGSGRMPANPSSAELDAVVDRVAAARQALGRGGDVAIDLHGRFTLAAARRLAALLEPLHPFFLEEPVAPEYSGQLARLVGGTSIPIATGERLYGKEEFLPVLESGVAVVQPDLSHAGGISESRRIAVLADTFGASFAPHCPLGPIALASCLQLGFASPNLLIQEHGIGIHYNAEADVLDYLADTSPLVSSNGYIPLLTRPGLGIEVDENAVRAADRAFDGWLTPTWRHTDGAHAEW